MKTPSALLAATLALLPALWPALGAAQGNLNDARAAVRKGTTEGIVLIPARKARDPAPAASATTTAGGVATAASAATPGAPAAAKPSLLGGLLENIRLTNPPSGQSLQAAKRDESASRGIPLPFAGSASRPASAPR
ncbi:MAG TPA: hypothetical protein VFQ20_01300 [Burkholderiaceae bacterium]|nr:hypothetical protein [Burkholderiaceae bacterium]